PRRRRYYDRLADRCSSKRAVLHSRGGDRRAVEGHRSQVATRQSDGASPQWRDHHLAGLQGGMANAVQGEAGGVQMRTPALTLADSAAAFALAFAMPANAAVKLPDAMLGMWCLTPQTNNDYEFYERRECGPGNEDPVLKDTNWPNSYLIIGPDR